MKRKFFQLTLLSLLFPMIANAWDAKINGIFYNLSGSDATVTKGNSSTDYSGSVVIPQSFTYSSKTYTVKSIGDYAFRQCSGLTSVSIPGSVTSIGEWAFEYCSGLTSISIPGSVTSIGDRAFSYCSSLKSINVDAGNTTYDSRNDCNAIIKTATNTLIAGCQNTIIPESVISIGSSAFSGCSGLTSITIPNSVTSIGDGAFSDCSGLTSITIPNSVISIGRNPVSNCDGLISIKVEGRNTTYDSRNDCNAIIEKVTNTLIAGCQKTKIPNTVTSIGEYAFYGSSLTSIIIPNSVTSIGVYAFLGCSSLTSVTIGNGVTSINGGAFYRCSSLISVTIPNSVTSIGQLVFQSCSSLASVSIGSGVTSISYYVFENCDALSNVYCFAKKVPTTNESAFADKNTSATLYVPEASIDLYKAVSPWNKFKKIVALGPEQLNTLSCSDITAHCGQQVELPVNLTNENEVKLCQFDLQLPDGVIVAKKSDGKLDAKLTERAESHSISSKQLENGNYRFVISSMDNDSFTGNEGTLLEIKLEISSTMKAGEYAVKLLNPELCVPDGNDLKVVIPRETESKLTVKDYIPGDVNNDGSVSVTDVGCAINYILEQVPSVFIFDAADMNGDKSISVIDVGKIINLILNEGAPNSQKRKAAQSATNPSNTLKVTGVKIEPGESIVLPIELENESTNLMGWQCDIVLPEGLSLALKNNGKPAATLGDRFAMTEHSISSSCLTNGAYRFIAMSMYGEAIPGTSGTLFSVTLKADASITPGTKTGIVTNIEFNTQDNQKLMLDDVTIDVNTSGGEERKCATPTIDYAQGKLVFNCKTEGAECVTNISDTDIKTHYGNEISLTATYTITVYATKDGYDNSNVATATLCWIDAEPKTEGIQEDAVTEVKAVPVLIQTQGGNITIQGTAEGTPIAIYSIDGKEYGSANAGKERTTIATSLRPGSAAVVKIGEKAVKVLIK